MQTWMVTGLIYTSYLCQPQVFGRPTSGAHSMVNSQVEGMTRAIINPLPKFLNPKILHESFQIFACPLDGHANAHPMGIGPVSRVQGKATTSE